MTIKLALEAPQKLLGMAQTLSDIDYISFSRYSRDKDYQKFCLESEGKNRIRFLSLDAEIDKDKLNKIVAELQVGIVIVPAKSYVKVAEIIGKPRTMPILGDSTPQEIFSSLALYAGDPASPLAVPAGILGDKDDSLLTLAYKRALVAHSLPNGFYIHLQGFISLGEFEWYDGMPNVGSISTGTPVMLGLAVQKLGKVDALYDSCIDEMENKMKTNPPNEAYTAIYSNIALLRKCLS
jgi:hypothetical protein